MSIREIEFVVDGKLIWKGPCTSYEMTRESVEGPMIDNMRTFTPSPMVIINVKTKE